MSAGWRLARGREWKIAKTRERERMGMCEIEIMGVRATTERGDSCVKKRAGAASDSSTVLPGWF